MKQLHAKAWIALILVALAIALVVFGAAGTLRYWQAWGFLVVYVGASALITVYLMKHDPALLARRMRGGPTAEKTRTQRIIISVASIAFIAALLVSALDHRFMWSSLPAWAAIAGDAATALSLAIMFLVLRENTFASATIETAPDQRVISSGAYGKVRHPMYAGGLLLFIAMPLALGSSWGVLAVLLALPAFIWRLIDEERFLADNLPGYAAYCARVRWRLVPGLF